MDRKINLQYLLSQADGEFKMFPDCTMSRLYRCTRAIFKASAKNLKENAQAGSITFNNYISFEVLHGYIHRLFISSAGGFLQKIYFKGMKFSPGQQVIVLDTMHKPAGAAIVQAYYLEAHRCTVLFQYPGSVAPESIPIPE